jgi:hypothetical protein
MRKERVARSGRLTRVAADRWMSDA